MKEKGFTLIELLAVIVILAIIALIATPIILGIIRDAKEESKEISAENYLSAVEQAIVRENMKGIFRPTECNIVDGKVTCEGKELKLEVDGEVPKNGTIYFSNGSVATGTLLNFDGYIKKINNLAKENVKAVTEKTKSTGSVPTQDSNGNIIPGSEFKIKVNDTSGWLTFFVLSNDGDYVNLIAEQNITPDGTFTSEPQVGDEWYETKQDNRYGPQTAYTYLSTATSKWINIPIIQRFNYLDEGNQSNSEYGYMSIVTKLEKQQGEYITTITPYSLDYGNPVKHKNMRARLPYESEVTENTTCTESGASCQVWMVNYLYGSGNYKLEQKVNSTGFNFGYWLLSSNPGSKFSARSVLCHGEVDSSSTPYSDTYGVRPVITILKSDLLRVME